MFEDKDFPGNNSSNGTKFSDAVWLRAKDIYETPKLYEGGIDPMDIQQGELGDCYYLCALSAIAEFPDRIEDLIEQKKETSDGKYTVNVFFDGVEQKIVLDDRFPCYSNEKKVPIFSRGKGGELWVLLLEKAYAKFQGNYQSIEAGSTFRALADLTGYPIKHYLVADLSSDDLWKYVKKYDEKKYIMACSVPDVPGVDLEKEVGLIEGHAYALIDALEVEGDRLFKIRNPWGKVEWNGAWSDSDPRWTPALRKKHNIQDADDGLFCISIEDFRKYFDAMSVVLYNKKYSKYSSVTKKVTAAKYVANLNVKKDGDCFISIIQPRKSNIPLRVCIIDEEGKPVGGTEELFRGTEVLSTEEIEIKSSGNFKLILEFHKDYVSSLPITLTLGLRSEEKIDIGDLEEAKDTDLFVLPEFKEKYGVCKKCEKVLNGSHMKVEDDLYHKTCFVCEKCGEALSSYVEIEDKFYCDKCGDEIE